MHILYVHQNFPAQFGHIAHHLVGNMKWRCTFVSETAGGNVGGIEKIQYKLTGGATKQNHFCSRTFENTVWHCDGVYHAMKARPDIRPDLIVGHSGFGSTLFLRELYPDVPVINFFEYYYLPHDPDSDMDFRSDLNWAIPEMKYLRSRCRNAMILLDLQNCQVGYTPTHFQKSKFPREYHDKVRVIFDGVDRSIYHGYDETLRPPPGEAHATYDLSKFHFVGRLNPPDLGRVLAAGDLHIYLTVPFVLSWSMMDAMSCGAVVLGSATSPVKEMIKDGENGLLADFFDPAAFAAKAIPVLNHPAA